MIMISLNYKGYQVQNGPLVDWEAMEIYNRLFAEYNNIVNEAFTNDFTSVFLILSGFLFLSVLSVLFFPRCFLPTIFSGMFRLS